MDHHIAKYSVDGAPPVWPGVRLPEAPKRNSRYHGIGVIDARSCRSGFTILELLVIIAIVSILMALLLPSLQRVRRYARSAVSLSNMRSHAGILTAYTLDYNDFCPYLTSPSSQYSVLRGGGLSVLGDYFIASHAWNYGLADRYYGGDTLQSSFYDPDDKVGAIGSIGFSSYRYACTLFTAPAYWNPSTRLAGVSQWTAVRISEIRFTSGKAVLSSFYPAFAQEIQGVPEEARSYTIALSDGSARPLRLAEMGRQYISGDGASNEVHPGHSYWDIPGLHTVDGAKGRDFQ